MASFSPHLPPRPHRQHQQQPTIYDHQPFPTAPPQSSSDSPFFSKLQHTYDRPATALGSHQHYPIIHLPSHLSHNRPSSHSSTDLASSGQFLARGVESAFLSHGNGSTADLPFPAAGAVVPENGNSCVVVDNRDSQYSNSMLKSFQQSVVSLTSGVHPLEAVGLQKTIDAVVLDFAVDERVTYQYALRFALLLEEDAHSVAPALPSKAFQRFNGLTDAVSSCQNGSSTSLGNRRLGYRVRPPQRLENIPQGGFLLDTERSLGTHSPASLRSNTSTSSVARHGLQRQLGIPSPFKDWRTSLANISESALRILGGDGKKHSRAQSSRLRMVNTPSPQYCQSSSLPPTPGPIDSPGGPQLAESLVAAQPQQQQPQQQQQASMAYITQDIIKVVTKCLSRQVKNDSVHPFTKSCYQALADSLKNKSFARYLCQTGSIDDILKAFAQFVLEQCKHENIDGKEEVSRIVLNQVARLVGALKVAIEVKSSSNGPVVQSALRRLDCYLEMDLPGVIPQTIEYIPPAIGYGSNGGPGSRVAFSSTPPAISPSPSGAGVFVQRTHYSSASEWLQYGFQMQPTQHRYISQQLKQEVSEANSLDDLKKWLQLVKMDRSLAGRPEDFISESAYRRWRNREETSLGQLIMSFMYKKTGKSSSPLDSTYSHQSSSPPYSGENYDLTAFHFVPENAPAHYRKLVERAVQHDIASPVASLPPAAVADGDNSDGRAATPIVPLSPHAEDLLKQCAIGWRISLPFRSICYLEFITDHVVHGRLPVSYLADALCRIEKVSNLIPITDWAHISHAYLIRVQEQIENYVFGKVNEIISDLHAKSYHDTSHLDEILRRLAANDVWIALEDALCLAHSPDRRRYTKGRLQAKVEQQYHLLHEKVFGRTESYEFNRFHQLAVLILEDYNQCRTLFPAPELGENDQRYDVPGIVFEAETRCFVDALQSKIQQHDYSPDGANIEAALHLHQSLVQMNDTLNKVAGETIESIALNRLFHKNVDHWLDILERESSGWVKNAIKLDKRSESSEINKHTTSANDIVVAFTQQVEMLQRISWPDTETKGRFITRFAKILSQSFEKYAVAMEQVFASTLSRTKVEMQKRKNYSVDKTAGLVYFTPAMCAKINNIAYVLYRLFDINRDLGIAELIEELGGEDRPSPKHPSDDGHSYLFSVKVIRAEGLRISKVLRDNEPDEEARPYVKIISPCLDEYGVINFKNIGKTRRVGMNGTSARWEQTFDYEYAAELGERSVPIQLRVCTRRGPNNLVPRERVHAQSYFPLSPKLLCEVDSSQDLVLDLEPAGYLYINVTIDREKDDVKFYFGRVVRTLTRTQAYMESLIIEHITSFLQGQLRQCVQVSRRKHRALDAIDKRISAFRRGPRRSSASQTLLEGCEERLMPIFNYLENNLHMVYQELYYEVANNVILRVWNEVLGVFQDLLLPPLYGKVRGNLWHWSEQDLGIIYAMLEDVKWYFNGGDDADGIPIEDLECKKYHELMTIRELYSLPVPVLIDRYVRSLRDIYVHSPLAKLLKDKSSAILAEHRARPASPQSGDEEKGEEEAGNEAEPPATPSSTDTQKQAQRLNLGLGFWPSTENRANSVWMPKDMDSFNSFIKRQVRMGTNESDTILRILRLRSEREATRFVQGQLDARIEQMRYEMKQIMSSQQCEERRSLTSIAVSPASIAPAKPQAGDGKRASSGNKKSTGDVAASSISAGIDKRRYRVFRKGPSTS